MDISPVVPPPPTGPYDLFAHMTGHPKRHQGLYRFLFMLLGLTLVASIRVRTAFRKMSMEEKAYTVLAVGVILLAMYLSLAPFGQASSQSTPRRGFHPLARIKRIIALLAALRHVAPPLTRPTATGSVDDAIEQAAQRLRRVVLVQLEQEHECHLQVVIDALYAQTATATTPTEVLAVERRLILGYINATMTQCSHLPDRIESPARALGQRIAAGLLTALSMLSIVANALQVALAGLSFPLLVLTIVLLFTGAVVGGWRLVR